MTHLDTTSLDTLQPARRTVPFGAALAAASLVLGAGLNTLQPVLGQVLGGRPAGVADQAALAAAQPGLVTAMALAGTLAVPFMAIGFVAAAHLLARRLPWIGRAAGTLLVLGMWGFLGVQTSQLLQVNALFSGADGLAAAEWLSHLQSVPLLGILFMGPFLIGCVAGMLTLTIGLLLKGAGVPRWIPAAWLVFIVVDFSVGAVGPVDPHWLYLAGAIGLAHHILREGGRAWHQG